jgi:uncharacterized protein (TIGR01777 family)
MHVLISGASGLIGTELTAVLREAGHRVTALVRRPATTGEVQWDPGAGVLPPEALNGVDAVVNLAGAGIGDHRWTPAYRQELVDSRVRSTTLLAARIAESDAPPQVLLSGSAVGYYGPRDGTELDEASPAGGDFLAGLCVQWEAATAAAEEAGVRVAHLRTGIVLTRKGGALKKMLPLFRVGLGGRFGKGNQWQSWISLADEVGAISHLLSAQVRGPVNLTAPTPVTGAEFAHELGRALHRPSLLPVPAFAPRLLLGSELADSLLFTGQKVMPRALQRAGYDFRHPRLPAALHAALA